MYTKETTERLIARLKLLEIDENGIEDEEIKEIIKKLEGDLKNYEQRN